MHPTNLEKRNLVKAIFLILGFLALPLGFNACGDVNLNAMPEASYVDEGSAIPPYTKPALAVRGATCLMCHAQVQGDVITDFGYNNPFFLHDRYDMRSDAWSSTSINGNLIVPVGLLDKNNTASLTIAQGVVQNGGFHGTVAERQEVFIGAPTEEVITNLTHLPDAAMIKFEWDVSAYAIGTSFIRGLVAQQGPQGDFFWTNPIGKELWCEGDVILLGPIHWNNLQLKTSSQGCRIYTTKTIFVTGPITYVDSPADANLQMSSSRAIFIGMRDLEARMEGHITGIRVAPDASQEQAFNAKIYEDRDKIGPTLVEDTGPFKTGSCAGRRAGTWRYNQPNLEWRYLDTKDLVSTTDVASCAFDGVDWAGKTPDGKAARKSYDYNGLVLNAPKVHGRYYGNFKGLVIGEDVIFAIDNFKFQFDPTFTNITVLPLLKGRILRVSDQ